MIGHCAGWAMSTTSKVKQILSRIPTWAKIKISGRNLISFLEIVLEVHIHPTAAQTLTGKVFFSKLEPMFPRKGVSIGWWNESIPSLQTFIFFLIDENKCSLVFAVEIDGSLVLKWLKTSTPSLLELKSRVASS